MLSKELLRTIYVVAEAGNFSVAAEKLYKVPSAVSYTIKKAEEELGIVLFEKVGRNIKLTPAGRYFIDNSQWISNAFDELIKESSIIEKGIDSEFTLAINNIIHTDGLVEFTQLFNRQFPCTQLNICTEVYNGCWDALYTQRVDFVIGAPHYAPKYEGIRFQPIGEIEWDFVVSQIHPLAKCTHLLSSSELRCFPAILVKDTSQQILPQNTWSLPGQKIIYVPELTTAIKMLVNGVGIGYIPHHRIKNLLDEGLLIKKAIIEQKKPTKLFYAWKTRENHRILQWCIDYLLQPHIKQQWHK